MNRKNIWSEDSSSHKANYMRNHLYATAELITTAYWKPNYRDLYGNYRKVDKTVKMHINSLGHWVVSALFSYTYVPYKRHLRDQKQQNRARLSWATCGKLCSQCPLGIEMYAQHGGKIWIILFHFLQRQTTSTSVCFSLNVHVQGLCQQRKCSLISQTLLCKSQESFVQAQWRSKMFQGIFLTIGMKLVWFTHETNMAEFPRLRVMG